MNTGSNQMSEREYLDTIAKMLNNMKADLGAVLQAQQLSSWIAISNNPMYPEDFRKECANRVMAMMNYQPERNSEAAQKFIV